MSNTNMTKKPLISVLMGIYNCEDTLEKAVQCIINQTYSKWELIMCDDCSTDGTLDVAQQLVEKDKRIRLITNVKNLTLAPTLNHCLAIAKGDYIARMDGDDICAYDRFEKELSFLEKHREYALVSCNMELFDGNGVYRTIFYLKEPTKRDFVRSSQFCHAGCMMRTEVMRQLNGYSIDRKCQRVEDYDLWVRMYEAGYKGYNLQEPLYSMRDDRNAMKRRSFCNRMNEARLKQYICKNFKLPVSDYLYVAVPIIKWLIPSSIYRKAHRKI